MSQRAKPGNTALSHLPSVQEIDRHLESLGLPSGQRVRPRVERVLAGFRARLLAGPIAIEEVPTREDVLRAAESAIRQPEPGRLRRVINATGVVVHTNLGRAVLAPETLAGVLPLLHGYTNLEFDLDSGKRGERGGKVPELLARLSGAERGLAVNNNAAAVLLTLAALAAGGEVIVSRGELVEIGGSFRVPEIMAQSGARLVEVGTTNRTRLADYAAAITPDTRGLLKVHRSNFTMAGFVEEVDVSALAALGRERGLPVWHDLGSGSFYRFSQPALAQVLTVSQHLSHGADVLSFSGDKLLGSVQAGLIVGRAEPLGRIARHPLYRSLRLDKVRLALLERSLEDYLEPETLRARNPTIDCLERTVAEMEPLAAAVTRALQDRPGALHWELARDHSLAGGGALPELRIETLCLALERPGVNAEALTRALREGDPPVIARVQDGRVWLDFRTVLQQDVPDLTAALSALGN